MAKWDYGGAYLKHDMTGRIDLPNSSAVQVCDWTVEPLPEFMLRADTLFIDPPWSLGNVKSFYTKAGKETRYAEYIGFCNKLVQAVDKIHPSTVFLEMGKQYLGWWLERMSLMFPSVTFYNSTYYHKKSNKCYVIQASRVLKKRRSELEDMDEEDIIAWICANHGYSCIGDLCMGRGLVGRHAYLAGKKFVGTELNPKRLAVLVDFIIKNEERITK
jgi:hypothetical protein